MSPREDHVGDHGHEVVEESDDQADNGDQGDEGGGEPVDEQVNHRHHSSCQARVPVLTSGKYCQRLSQLRQI